MAFFEQLGKKLTDAGQNVAQQTKNLSEIARLNTVVAEKEKSISQMYMTIGRIYYEQHKADEQAEALEQITAINAMLDEIAEHKDTIKKLKGIMQCPACGGDVASDAVFCNHCGTRIAVAEAEPAAPETQVCPNCQAPVGPENRFCNSCGYKLVP